MHAYSSSPMPERGVGFPTPLGSMSPPGTPGMQRPRHSNTPSPNEVGASWVYTGWKRAKRPIAKEVGLFVPHLRLICILLVLAVSGASNAFCQAVNATLLGTITDVSGARVARAQVLIAQTNTGIAKTAQANESGNYIFPDLPPGR